MPKYVLYRNNDPSWADLSDYPLTKYTSTYNEKSLKFYSSLDGRFIVDSDFDDIEKRHDWFIINFIEQKGYFPCIPSRDNYSGNMFLSPSAPNLRSEESDAYRRVRELQKQWDF